MTLCKTSTFLICSLTYTSIGYFVVLSIERYVAIVYPFQYKSWFSHNNQIICLLLAPLYGFSMGAAPLLGWSGYAKSQNNSLYCTFDFELKSTNSYFIIAILLAFIGPVLVIVACVKCIIVELKCKLSRTQLKFGEKSAITVESSKAVAGHTLFSFLTGLIFIASWLPYSVVCFMYFTDHNVSDELETVAKYLSKSSTISSTIVHCLIEKRFRCFLTEWFRTKISKIGQNHRQVGRRRRRREEETQTTFV